MDRPHFIYLSVDGHLDRFHLLGIINAAVHTGIQCLFSVFLCTDLGVGLLSQVAILCLAFGGTTKLFSIAAAPFFIPISSALISPHPLQYLLVSILLLLALLLLPPWWV